MGSAHVLFGQEFGGVDEFEVYVKPHLEEEGIQIGGENLVVAPRTYKASHRNAILAAVKFYCHDGNELGSHIEKALRAAAVEMADVGQFYKKEATISHTRPIDTTHSKVLGGGVGLDMGHVLREAPVIFTILGKYSDDNLAKDTFGKVMREYM